MHFIHSLKIIITDLNHVTHCLVGIRHLDRIRSFNIHLHDLTMGLVTLDSHYMADISLCCPLLNWLILLLSAGLMIRWILAFLIFILKNSHFSFLLRPSLWLIYLYTQLLRWATFSHSVDDRTWRWFDVNDRVQC